jgi:hypothetical protein
MVDLALKGVDQLVKIQNDALAAAGVDPSGVLIGK